MPYSRKHMLQAIKNTLNLLDKYCYVSKAPLSLRLWKSAEPLPFERRFEGTETPLFPGVAWGDLWDCGWLSIRARVPNEGGKYVLRLDVGGEALLFDSRGTALQGLTCKASTFDTSLGRPGKWNYTLPETGDEEYVIELWADIACNDLFGALNEPATVSLADVALCREEYRSLWYDIAVLLDLYESLNPQSARAGEVIHALYRAAGILRDFSEDQVREAAGVLAPVLAKKGADPSLTMTAIGHAHMDLAWLWPIRETKRKVARTFATALKMMETYPDYRFGQSQPQQYEWLKQEYPELYERVKKAVAEGRIEPQGGMWVESDTNVPNGESLIRQFYYGRKFFSEEFGVTPRTLWLPDVFGYSAALPKIMKGCGIDYFMTQKLSWNEHTHFPHHTFRWRSPDGSTVLAHMLPEETYNSPLLPHSLIKAEQNYAENGVCPETLVLFGIGDGGGGPGEEHLERFKRVRNLSGLCPVNPGFGQAFFDRISEYAQEYPLHEGELYLERHQGTYTTQARNKQYNHLLEQALHKLEWLQAVSGMGAAQQEARDTIWKEVLLYQFHDILPGSSIDRVYKESCQRYQTLLEQIDVLCEECLNVIRSANHGCSVLNSSPFPQKGWVRMGDKLRYVEVPAYSALSSSKSKGNPPVNMYAHTDILENTNLKVVFAEDGSIDSVYDKRNHRNVLKPGCGGNLLRVYEDRGDCWDILFSYRGMEPEQPRLVTRRFYVEDDMAIIEQDYTIGNSDISQKFILRADAVRLDIETEVNWQERGKMLRAAFYPDVQTSVIHCGNQFGSIERSMKNNTPEEFAQIEICAQKWVEMREGGYGVAVMSDCKYGYYAKEGQVEIDLLRSASYPGRTADAGIHRFSYSLYPHELTEDVNMQAYLMSMPLEVVPGVCEIPSPGLSGEGIIWETVKPAEDGSGIILRAYESRGERSRAVISLPGELCVRVCDLLENSIREIKPTEEGYSVEMKAFEVKTFRLTPVAEE